MKEFFAKYGPIVGVVCIVLLVLFVVKLQYDAKSRDEAITKSLVEMKELQDGVVRAQARYVSKKDLEQYAKDNNLNIETIQEDLDELGADLKGISKVVVRSLGVRATNVGSSGTTPRPSGPNDPPAYVCDDPTGAPCYPDPYGYQTSSQHLGLTEPFQGGTEVPIGDVTFDAWKEKPWTIEVNPRDYLLFTTLGQDEDGRHYVHNKVQISSGGETYDIPIDQAELLEKYPDPSFYWNPKVHLGMAVGALVRDPRAEVLPNAQLTMFTYGKTKTYKDTEWTFLGLGVGYGTQNNSFNVVSTPVMYNLGRHIPLMNNLHIGPTISVDTKGEVFVGAGLSVGM